MVRHEEDSSFLSQGMFKGREWSVPWSAFDGLERVSFLLARDTVVPVVLVVR